jgi:phosphoribosylamine-glycine ligase
MMNGNLGANNGCSGNIVWMPDRETLLFQKSLGKCVEALADMDYVGPMDLAVICNPEGAWGLEFCPRFTYEGTQLLTRLLPCDFTDFLYAVASNDTLPDLPPRYSFAASVRLSIPPYPNDVSDKYYKATEGIPIDGLCEEDLDKFYAWDVRRREDSDELETAGISGLIGTPLAVGETPGQAFHEAYDVLKDKICVPNAQYRTDIAEDTIKRYFNLRNDGWLKRCYREELVARR